MRSYYFEHSIDIGHDFMVPEAKYRESLRIEPVGPFGVFFLFLRMLTTICLYDNTFFIADKIGNEAANLFLPPEF